MMKQLRFLLKPFFYICSLVFATWLVIAIEKISPSDFSSQGTQKETPLKVSPEVEKDKVFLENLCKAYRAGTIDSAELGKRLLWFLKSKKDLSGK